MNAKKLRSSVLSRWPLAGGRSSNQLTAYGLRLTFVLVLAVTLLSSRHSAAQSTGGFVPPPSNSFDHTVGEPIQNDLDSALFVGAFDYSNDGKPDVITADKTGLISLYTNVIGTDEGKHRKFRPEGEGIKLDGTPELFWGEDFNQDGTIDMAVVTVEKGKPALVEVVGRITAVTDKRLTDATAEWKEDELQGLEINPNINQTNNPPKTYVVAGNTAPGQKDKTKTIKDLPERTLEVTKESLEKNGSLNAIARVGDYYSYQRGSTEGAPTPTVHILLNDGKGAFTPSACETQLEVPANSLLERIESGRFDDDQNPDLAMTYTKFRSGRSTKLDVKFQGMNEFDYADFFDPPEDAPERNDDVATSDVMVNVVLEDKKSEFTPDLVGQLLNPNIRQHRYFKITDVNAHDHTLKATLQLGSVMSYLEAGSLLSSMGKTGDQYRIKTGERQVDVYQGDGQGCFQKQDFISGEDWELHYGLVLVNGSYQTHSVLRVAEPKFGPKDSLVGRQVNVNAQGKDTAADGPKLFHIVANDETSLYFDVADGDVRAYATDQINNENPSLFVILPETSGSLYSTSRVNPNAINSFLVPAFYMKYSQDQGGMGPPYSGAFADFDGDSDIDLVYSGATLYFKPNHETD